MAQARITLADARRAIDDLRTTTPADPESAICREVARFSEATGIAAECQIAPDLGPIEDVAETLLRILSEALTNAARHAQAQRVIVTAERKNGVLLMTIVDDGCGFDPSAVAAGPSAVAAGHFGLLGMRERARLIGGEVELSSRPGAGTTVTARLPLEGH